MHGQVGVGTTFVQASKVQWVDMVFSTHFDFHPTILGVKSVILEVVVGILHDDLEEDLGSWTHIISILARTILCDILVSKFSLTHIVSRFSQLCGAGSLTINFN